MNRNKNDRRARGALGSFLAAALALGGCGGDTTTTTDGGVNGTTATSYTVRVSGLPMTATTLHAIAIAEGRVIAEEDRRRLRRKQRLYLEEWVHLVNEMRTELSDADSRTLVHAAIGAIQSPLFHSAGLAEDRLRVLLADAARAVLGAGR